MEKDAECQFLKALTTLEKNNISELFHEAKERSGFKCEYTLRFIDNTTVRCEIDHKPPTGLFDRDHFGKFTQHIAKLFKNSRVFSPDGKESEITFNFVDGSYHFVLESYR